ncbi:MAG: NEW3 domain-containing protein [Thermoleophilia bacterium]|nr:NEW3 domain-containing protein [Thermoleophilia bacterium]
MLSDSWLRRASRQAGEEQRGRRRRERFLIAGVLTAALSLGLAGPWVASAGALTLTTPYPVMAVQPGQTATLAVNVANPDVARVDLSIAEAPEGWVVSLRGAGKEVSAIYADPQSPPALELRVDVPTDAAKGDYKVVVRATGAGAQLDLPLTLRVTQEASGGTSLQTDFTTLRGPSDAAFRFSIDLQNAAPDERTYNIAGQGPEGWKVSLLPAGAERETPSLTVQGDGSQRLNLEVTPAADTPAGSYPVTVTATGGGEKAGLDLTIEVTGTYDLVLTTPDERLNADIKGGGSTRVPLVVQNNGTGPLQGVSFSATPPTDWKVAFDPQTIDVLDAGEEATVTAVFTPAGNAIAGDYAVSLSARADQAMANTDLRVTVTTSTWWGIVGVVLIAVALGGLLLVFRRWGHR